METILALELLIHVANRIFYNIRLKCRGNTRNVKQSDIKHER